MLNLVIETTCEYTILQGEVCAENFLKDAATPQAIHFACLTHDPFSFQGALHRLTVVFGVRCALGVAS